jgi:hypothetical protein
MLQFAICLHAGDKFAAAEPWHVKIKQDCIKAAAAQALPSIDPIDRGEHIAAAGRQLRGRNGALQGIVIDDEDLGSVHVTSL